jgi:hypothetical protein
MLPERSPAVARLGWTLADQAVSSTTTLLVLFVLARNASVEVYGAIGLAQAMIVVTIGLTRAAATEPLVVEHTGRYGWNDAARRAIGVSGWGGLVGALVVGAFAALHTGDTRVVLVIVAIALPFLATQDGWRFVALSAGVPSRAFLNDLCWMVILLALCARSMTGPGVLTMSWVVGGIIAAVVGTRQFRMLPTWSKPQSWVREKSALSLRCGVEFVCLAGAVPLVTIGVGMVVGVIDAGSLRAAAVIAGMPVVVVGGIHSALIAEGARQTGSPRTFARLVLLAAAVTWLSLAMTGVICRVVPGEWGEAVLGDRWTAARPLFVPVGFALAGIYGVAVVAGGMRAIGRSDLSVRLVTGTAGLAVLAGMAGAFDGPAAAAWSMSIPSGIGLIVGAWWWTGAPRRLSTSGMHSHGVETGRWVSDQTNEVNDVVR